MTQSACRIFVGLTFAASTCGRSPTVATLLPLFGPAVGNEVISGRMVDERDRIVLLASGKALVTVDLSAQTIHRTPVQLADPHCWGLARLADGSMWTLENRTTLAQLSVDGSIVREVRLDGPHLGLFAAGDRLIYQVAALEPYGAALRAGAAGDATHVPWSDLVVRPFEGLFHPGMVALNMVNCGVGLRGEMPCWFPDEPTLFLVTPTGQTRRIELEGLVRADPATLLSAETPARPIRDAYVDRGGTIWVLSSGTRPAGVADRPGAWLLVRFGSRGERIDSRPLAESARLILQAASGRAVVLTGNGMVAELLP